MAGDVRALMDHLGWQKAHIMGMSLGGETPSHLSLSSLISTASTAGCFSSSGAQKIPRGCLLQS